MKNEKKGRLLFICGDLPYPIVSGRRKREFEMLSDLSEIFDIELLCITRNFSQDVGNSKHLKRYAKSVVLLSANPPSDCVLSEEVNIEDLFKRFNTKKVSNWLLKNVNNFDTVHVERDVLFPDELLQSLTTSLVVSEQNVESQIVYQVLASNKKGVNNYEVVEKYYAKLLVREKKIWEKANKIVTITEFDAEQIKREISNQDKVLVIPLKFDNDRRTFGRKKSKDHINLMYLGNFNYFPNVISANKIFTEIIPLLNEMKVNFKFRILGSGANKIRNGYEDAHCKIIDFTEDMSSDWKWVDLSILSIYYGGGLKTKILDSLNNRVPVITTYKGLNGFEHYKSKFIFSCNNSREMIELVKYFADNPLLLSAIIEDLRKTKLKWDLPENMSTSAPLLYNQIINE